MSEFETYTVALIECVKASGGSKVVGGKLWPELPIDHAQRKLLACLNDERPERLTPDQTIFVMRLAREAGCHAGVNFICTALGYTIPNPIDHKDEAAELKRQFIAATTSLLAMAEKIERLEK